MSRQRGTKVWLTHDRGVFTHLPGSSCRRAAAIPASEAFPDPGVPRLFLSGDGSGCSGNGGEFTVRQLSLSPQNTVLRFAADFILNCGSSSGTLTGSVQYNSTVDVPVTTMSVDPAAASFCLAAQRIDRDAPAITAGPAPDSEPSRRWMDSYREPTLDSDLSSVWHQDRRR